MKKGLVIILACLLCFPLVLGATIHGKMFSYSLSLVENSIVSISTVPEQVVVSTDGAYSFSVPVGDYQITAYVRDDTDAVTHFVEENISVVDDGDYVRDLILFPVEDLEELDLEKDIEQDLKEEEQAEKEMPLYIRIILGIIMLGVLAVIIWFAMRTKKPRDLTGIKLDLKQEPEELPESKEPEEPDDLADLLAFIKKHKRATQKDIRKHFALSEAKISLMIADLESQGKVKKIKKGRGNIIVFVKV